MTKRIIVLLLCLVMLLAMPVSAFASEPDTAAPAPSSVRYISSGEISFGTAVLYDAWGNELPVEYAYSPRITISQSIAGQLSEMLADCGFSLPAMSYDYQLMNMQSFFVVRVTDGQALAAIIDAMVNKPAADITDTAANDAVLSPSDVSGSDLSGSDVYVPENTPETSTTAPAEDSAPANTTSLHALLFGSATFEAYPTLEASFAKAFPEFTFTSPEPAALPQSLNYVSGVAVDPDGMTAQITVIPEPEYVEREVFGEVFQVLMVSSVAYRYELSRFDISGLTDGAVIPDKPVDIVSPSDVTTTAPTTTTTFVELTTTTASTTGSTTTTTAPTTTTTTAAPVYSEGYPREAVVTTRWMRLNVRSGPGTEYKIVAKLDKGDMVTVLEYNEAEGWYRVKLSDGTTGWCTDEYITLK